MQNILVDSVGLFDAALYNATGKGSLDCYKKLLKAENDGVYPNFVVSEYSIINASALVIDYGNVNNVTRAQDRRIQSEFEKVLEPYFTPGNDQYFVYRIPDLRHMIQIGEFQGALKKDFAMEEVMIAYLASRAYEGASVIGIESEIYTNLHIPMFHAFPIA